MSKVKDLLKRFYNQVQSAAVVDNAPVMTASGWRINRGQAVQDSQNNKDVKQLRSNLAKIKT